jgi:hypothetical protein
MVDTLHYRFTIRDDTDANWKLYDGVLYLSELGYNTDTREIKIGDGVKRWSALPVLVRVDTGQSAIDALAKANQALASVVRGDNVYSRFAPEATPIDGTNIDTRLVSGQYRGSALAGSPNGDGAAYWYLEVIRHDDNFVMQRITGLNTASSYLGAMLTRTRENGVWGAWYRPLLLSQGQTAVDFQNTGGAVQTFLSQGADAYRRFAPNAFNLAAGTNLDALRESGQYRGNSLVSTPGDQPQEWFYVEVVAHGSDYNFQRVTQFTGSGRGRMWQRLRYADSYEAWRRIWTESTSSIPESDLDLSARTRITQGSDAYDRFGPKAKQLVNGYDLNTLWQGGQYKSVAPANAPIVVGGQWWYIEVMSHEPGYTIQRATGMTSYYLGIQYIRNAIGGTWSAWQLVGGGDTKARSITAALTNVVTDANSACTIRRVDNLVTLKLINFKRAAGKLAPEPVYTVPAGFRSSTEETGSGINEGGTGVLIGAFMYVGGRVRLFNLPDSENYNKVTMTWITDDAWPAVLP